MEHHTATVAGSQDEPFYELLHPNTPLASSASHSPPNGLKKEDDGSAEINVVGDDAPPSFDFQPTQSVASTKAGASKSGWWAEENSVPESREREPLPSSSPISHEEKVYSFGEASKNCELVKSKQANRDAYDTITVAAIEQTMKKYADDILHVLEGMSHRLSQLEFTTQHLEHSVQDLKAARAENYVETDGSLRKLENLIKQVQSGVEILRDKQEKTEGQFELLKLELSNNTHTSGIINVGASDRLQQSQPLTTPSPYHQQSPLLTSQTPLQPHASPPSNVSFPLNIPNEPVSPSIQQQPHSSSPLQQHAVAPSHVQQSLPSHQSTQVQPFYSQQSRLQHVSQGRYSQEVEANPYGFVGTPSHGPPPISSGHYAPELSSHVPESFGGAPPRRFMTSQHPPPPPPSSQQYVPGGPQGYELNQGRAGSTVPLSPPYFPQTQQLPYETQSGGYGSPPLYRVGQPVPTGTGGYPRLPTAQPLQHALPMSTSGGGSSGGAPLSTNRVSIDEVIENVAAMGFSRDQVMAVVRYLTENGQSVDLNVVLDKLMNGEVQSQKRWIRQ